ncbi:YciI family protein [Micromonospora marina]|uniref:YciI family protein n=1 Tax=Micromonospora marina TaxID=307120 RepID=UPI003D72DCC6
MPGGRDDTPGQELVFTPSYLITAIFAADAAVRREPYRAAHLAHMRALLVDGTALVAGAHADLGASVLVLRAADESAARAHLEQDPYWRHGVWTAIDVVGYLVATAPTLGRS